MNDTLSFGLTEEQAAQLSEWIEERLQQMRATDAAMAQDREESERLRAETDVYLAQLKEQAEKGWDHVEAMLKHETPIMNLHDLPLSLRNHFEQTPDMLNGKLRIRGTRVSVEQVLELLNAGLTPAEIVPSFPSLTEPDVAAVERLAIHYALATLQPV